LKWALLDQKSHGSCVGFSAAGALMWDLWAAGFPPPGKLSGAYIYSWINGNRDAGASIVAALRALREHGTCLESTVPWNVIYRRQMPAGADEEAQRFKLETGGSLSGSERMVSALQCSKPVQFGVSAGGRFSRFDDEGVAGYNGRGSNHSVFSPPLLVKKSNGDWKAPLVNSWNLWGPWRSGWCYVDQRHYDGGGGGFLHGTPNYDPKAPEVAAGIAQREAVRLEELAQLARLVAGLADFFREKLKRGRDFLGRARRLHGGELQGLQRFGRDADALRGVVDVGEARDFG